MSFLFNGVNQSLSATATARSPVPITLFARALHNNTAASMGIFMFSDATGGGSNRAAICFSTTSGLFFGYGTTYADVATARTAGQWLEISGGGATSSSRKVFVNGVSNTSTVTSAPSSTASVINIGALNFGTLQSFLNGMVAEVAMWDVDITVAEQASLSKGFKPYRVRPQSLIFYAPLLRNLHDIRGGIAITNNNSATVANHPRVYG